MSFRSVFLALCAAVAFAASSASAAMLVSQPLSHPAGFQSVTCHIINGGTKPITVDSFWIDDVEVAASYGNTFLGCTGQGPWVLQPGQGCSRQFSFPSACNQPDACYCRASVSGSLTSVRGSFIATVNRSTTVLTSDLRAK
jgi:hypothetical protein